MSGIKLKRPSSARRNIKQETFSPFASINRLKNIQALLKSPKDNSDPKVKKPDSILCVLGIDGRYNDGTRELVNYLLFGFFDIRKLELERSGFAEEVIDDMIFYIRSQSVDIYCNPTNYHYLLPYVAHWRNLHLHCLSNDKSEDEEYGEEFKIKSFLSIVEGSQLVGIPYCGTGQQMQFDKMTIEKWPIVQAYAVEGVGGGTFFTMKYEVMDISPALHQVFNYVDPVALEMLLTEQLSLFERQWNNMLSVCDLERSEQSMQITEGKVCEPLSSYFSHGRVVTAKGGRSLPIRHPFVLFGTHTSHRHLEDAHKAGISFNSDPDSTGLQGQPAHHMICQAVSPRGPLSCTRTYFFDTPVAPFPMTKIDANIRNPSTKMTDARLLQEVYQALVTAVLQAVNIYSMTLSAEKAEEFARQILLSECRKRDVPLNPDIFKSRKCVTFHLSGYDNLNRPVPVTDGRSSPFVKTLGITVYDIPSLEHSDPILGSVSFAESFIESSINVLYPDGSHELNGNCTVLTSHVTRFITWPSHNSSTKCLASIERQLEDEQHSTFGCQLIRGEPAHIVVDGQNDIIIRSGDVFLYEQGVVFIHPHLGALVLPKSEISALHFYDGESSSTVALLIMSYKEHVQFYIPPHLKTDSYRITLAFQPRSKAYKALFSTVLPLWKQNDQQPVLEMLEELPPELKNIHHQLQQEYTQQTVLSHSVSSLKQVKCKLPDLHSFLQHFVASSVGEVPICSKHLTAVLEQPYDEGNFNDTDEMVITIIGGVPGSHQRGLCTSLTKLAKEDSRWAILKPSIESTGSFNPEVLQASLATTWKAQRRRKPGQSARKMRALVMTSGFTDIVDVVQAVVSHPDPDVSRCIKIGSVTVCVDPTNAFMQDMYTVPKLLDNCAQGWVNCVLFTGPLSSQQGLELEHLQQLVRACNSDVALLLASNGDVTRSPDIDLILSETAFNEESLIRARYLSCPGWWLGQFDSGSILPEMNELALQFSQPLEKRKLLLKLKSLRSSHTTFPFTGNMYQLRGKLNFSDSPQMFELDYVALSGSLILTPAELQPMPPSRLNNGHGPHQCANCIVFTGCDLEEYKLKEWLRACAKQKLEKKTPKTVNNLSKQEINKIHKQHHLDSLPEGWFYNGTHFVSLAGDRSDTHPELDQFLASYIDGVNREIKEYNHCIELETYHDLFED